MKKKLCALFTIIIIATALSVPASAQATVTPQQFFGDAGLLVHDWAKSAVLLGYYTSPRFTGHTLYAPDGYIIGTFTGKVELSHIQTVLDHFNDYRGVARIPAAYVKDRKNLAESGIALTTSDTVNPATEPDMELYAAEVFRLVNEERVKAGLSEVAWDDDFFTCAQIRAEEMARQTQTGHTRPEPPQDTEKQWPRNGSGKGLYNAPSVADELGVAYNWIWENAGAGYQTPEAVVKGWMNSPGHAANILREEHTRCGVGVFFTDEETPTGYSRFWALWLDG